MSETILLKQYDGATVTPKDDAIVYDAIIKESGILEGCDFTYLGAGQIRISEGRGIIKGRQFVVQSHTITVDLSVADTQPGRIYIHMELNNTVTPIQILSVTAVALPDLVQEEDCNLTNGVYEIELATYNVTTLAVENLQKTATVICEAKGIVQSDIIDSLEEIEATTEAGLPAGALAVKEVNAKLGGCWIAFEDEEGNPTTEPYIHWYEEVADEETTEEEASE